MTAWLAVAFVLAGCDGAPADIDTDDTNDTEDTDTGLDTGTDTGGDTDTEVAAEPALVGPEDGTYLVGFQREGDHFALGEFHIDRNGVTGSARSNDGMDVVAHLTVLADGSLRLDELTSTGTQNVVFTSGRVASGFLEGTYTVDGVPGSFAGRRRIATLFEAPNDLFDGLYEIALIRGEDEVGVTVVSVRGGALSATVVDVEGATTEVRGFVTSDGTFVLSEALQSTGQSVLAEATIDQDTYEVNGIFRSGDNVGRIVGRRAD